MTKRAQSTPRLGPLLSFPAIPFFADWGSTYYGFSKGLVEGNPLFANAPIWGLLGIKILIFTAMVLALVWLYRAWKPAAILAAALLYAIFSTVTVWNIYLINRV